MKGIILAIMLVFASSAVVEAGPVLKVARAVVTAPVKVVKKVQPLRKVARLVKGVAGKTVKVAGACACGVGCSCK